MEFTWDKNKAEGNLSTHGRLLIVSYTERGDAIRLISARETTRRERQDYEEG